MWLIIFSKYYYVLETQKYNRVILDNMISGVLTDPKHSYRMSGQREETFLYFAYGSNMLTQRIRINNPSARFLKDNEDEEDCL